MSLDVLISGVENPIIPTVSQSIVYSGAFISSITMVSSAESGIYTYYYTPNGLLSGIVESRSAFTAPPEY